MANNRNKNASYGNEKRNNGFIIENFNRAYEIFSKDSFGHESIDIIKEFMQYCVDNKYITSSQLRNVYNIVIDKDLSSAAKRVKLTYILARNNNLGMQTLINMLDKMLSQNCNYDTIHNFAEACVAYHKYFETLKK
jgi:CRISPR/Cas system CSM-associated protein Csm2 small subunit